jgi:predicted TPR repeat methyltransferase
VTSVYDSERLAAGYAFDRPPVHEQILRSARLDRQADQALDVGCGAGLSTAALAHLRHPGPPTSRGGMLSGRLVLTRW